MLGTTTKADTVNRALRLVVTQRNLRVEEARFDELLDLLGDLLAETDVRAEAWR